LPTGCLKFEIAWDSKEKGKTVILCYHAMIVLYEMNRVTLIQLEAAVYYILLVADYTGQQNLTFLFWHTRKNI